MNSLETMLVLSCWISTSILIASSLPVKGSRELIASANAKKVLLQAKVACDTIFLDNDYRDASFNLTQGTELAAGSLTSGEYSYDCAGELVPGREGIRVLAEKRWLK